MNFTREPIIETIISPKEGNKLLVRSTKGGVGAEEYYVDAVEVVSFGRAFFFRSLERPKAFLVPVSDYEILEVKETRVALKNVSHERNIKIGGGRDAPMRHREPVQEKESEPLAEDDQSSAEAPAHEAPAGSRMDKRRDRRRRRHRRSSDDQEWNERRPQEREQVAAEQKGGPEDEVKTPSQPFPSLIPPPSTLISETISRYKEKEATEGTPPSKEVEKKQPPVDEESSGSDSSPLHRTETVEVSSFTSTNFSPLSGGRDSFFY